MYGIAGERRLTEWEVPGCPGYENSHRCASAMPRTASCSSTSSARSWTRCTRPAKAGLAPSESGWDLQRELLAHLEKIWPEPDEGIWEVRGGRQHFTYSKVMAWVAFDRAIKSAETYNLPGPVDHWRAICATRSTTMSARTASTPSWAASCGPTARKNSTPACCCCRRSDFCRQRIRAFAARSKRSSASLMGDGLVLRYDTEKSDDGLPPGEGCFWPAASGWSTPMSCSAAATTPCGCSSGCWRCATISGC